MLGIKLGNCCDIDFADSLEYFEQDPDIKIIVLYIEAIKDGRRFIQVARRVARKKPILALKTGKSERGFKVAQSHTGSLAGKDEIYDAIFKQCGIIRVEDTEELVDLSKAFLRLPLMKGRGLGVITYPMSCGVMIADACQRHGLEIAELSLETKKKISPVLPSWAQVANPVDLTPPDVITGLGPREAFRLLLNALLEDERISGVLFIAPVFPAQREVYDFSKITATAVHSFPEKPIVCFLYCPDMNGTWKLKYEEAGKVTVFPSCERAIRALARLWEHYQFLGASCFNSSDPNA